MRKAVVKGENNGTDPSVFKRTEPSGKPDPGCERIPGGLPGGGTGTAAGGSSANAFFGSDILQMAVAGILAGENILLCGPKATGKNILAENLAWIFGRPVYNVSFHVNTDSSTLIGTDTFRDNEVTLRKGPVYQCAAYGGFGILDEINMAKNDAVAVLHATLDYRRIIDVPGYEKIDLHPATRFIGTMNYGYAGTKERMRHWFPDFSSFICRP